ncbi:MAG: YncE family protein, partial [Myxococcota bacterium]
MLRALAFLLLLLLAAPALGGGLFAAGRDSRSVVEYDSASGSLTRVFAETTDDGFQNPGGIALRPTDGVLYATSRSSGEIWSYDTPTGDVLTPAVASGLFRPGGCDFDAAGG